jgi:hypothetical protein
VHLYEWNEHGILDLNRGFLTIYILAQQIITFRIYEDSPADLIYTRNRIHKTLESVSSPGVEYSGGLKPNFYTERESPFRIKYV